MKPTGGLFVMISLLKQLIMPSYSRHLKTHLVLHLVSCIVDFGPTHTERLANFYYLCERSFYRYESFNSLVRTQNIYGNRHSPSKDISTNFAILQHLRFLCYGAYVDGKQ